MNDGFSPPAWNARECMIRMLRGCIRKAASLERDGAISRRDSEEIRDALAAAVVAAQDARWKTPRAVKGWDVDGSLPEQPAPAPEPLQTEGLTLTGIAWWRGDRR